MLFHRRMGFPKPLDPFTDIRLRVQVRLGYPCCAGNGIEVDGFVLTDKHGNGLIHTLTCLLSTTLCVFGQSSRITFPTRGTHHCPSFCALVARVCCSCAVYSRFAFPIG